MWPCISIRPVFVIWEFWYEASKLFFLYLYYRTCLVISASESLWRMRICNLNFSFLAGKSCNTANITSAEREKEKTIPTRLSMPLMTTWVVHWALLLPLPYLLQPKPVPVRFCKIPYDVDDLCVREWKSITDRKTVARLDLSAYGVLCFLH